jgi:hypothetical protein
MTFLIKRFIFFSVNQKSSKHKMQTPLMQKPLVIDESLLHGYARGGRGPTRAFATYGDLFEAIFQSALDMLDFVYRRQNLTDEQIDEFNQILDIVRRTAIFQDWMNSDVPGRRYWDHLVTYAVFRSRWDGRPCRPDSTAPPPLDAWHVVNLRRFYKTYGTTKLSMEFLVDPVRCCPTPMDPVDPPNGRRRWMRRTPSPIRLLGERG